MGWAHGKLVEPALEEEPPAPGVDVAALLDAAESIVNSIGPEAVREAQAQRQAQARASSKTSTTRWWGRLKGRSRRRH